MNLHDFITASATATGRPTIAVTISMLRAAQGLSQGRLAEQANLSASVVSVAEREGKLSTESLIAMGAALKPELGAVLADAAASGLNLGDAPAELRDELCGFIAGKYLERIEARRAAIEASTADPETSTPDPEATQGDMATVSGEEPGGGPSEETSPDDMPQVEEA